VYDIHLAILRILEEHEIEPLPKNVKEEIERIIREVAKAAAEKSA